MANVVKVEPSPKNAEWRVVTLDDTRQFIVFSASLADRLELGKPLPQGTEEQPPKFDGALPSLKLPRPQGGGGGGGWKNTKEAWELEQQMWEQKNALEEQRRRERQAYDQERTDRRTALMQAVESLTNVSGSVSHITVIERAEAFYAWLRSSPAPGDQEATKAAQGPAQAVPGPSQTSGSAAPPADAGKGGLGLHHAGPDSAESGEVDTGKVTSPGSTTYPTTGTGTYFPVKPEDCSHKFGTTGNWLKTVQIDGKPHCPRCGMSALLYRESDVGP